MNESAAQRTGGGADRCRRFSGLAEVRVGLGRRSADGGEYHHQNGHPVGLSKNTASAQHGPVIVETRCICQARSHLLKKDGSADLLPKSATISPRGIETETKSVYDIRKTDFFWAPF